MKKSEMLKRTIILLKENMNFDLENQDDFDISVLLFAEYIQALKQEEQESEG